MEDYNILDDLYDTQNKIIEPKGLNNLGNTCYMNASMQCLYATNLFRNLILKKLWVNDFFINKYNKDTKLEKINNEYDKSLIYTLYDLFNTINNNDELTEIKLKNLKNKISNDFKKYEGYNQEDSQDFLNFILEQIDTEIKSDVVIKYNLELKDLQNNKVLYDNLKIKYEKEIKRNYSLIKTLFYNTYLIESKCKSCNTTNIYEFQFDNMLKLDIFDCNNGIQNCINKLTERNEILEGFNCKYCKAKNTTERKNYIIDEPQILLVNLKRFDEKREKNNKNIIIEKEISLKKTSHPSKELNSIYKLYGFVSHEGGNDISSGHYVSYICNNNKWYKLNDSHTSEIKEEEVNKILNTTGNPYILFYEKENNKMDYTVEFKQL